MLYLWWYAVAVTLCSTCDSMLYLWQYALPVTVCSTGLIPSQTVQLQEPSSFRKPRNCFFCFRCYAKDVYCVNTSIANTHHIWDTRNPVCLFSHTSTREQLRCQLSPQFLQLLRNRKNTRLVIESNRHQTFNDIFKRLVSIQFLISFFPFSAVG